LGGILGDRDDAQEGSHGRADRCGSAAGGSRSTGGGGLSKGRDQRGDVYLWKRQYSGVGVSELRELRQLREENGRLKRLVADLSMDRQILQEIVSKKL
jgi:hypothetical protein